MLIFLIIIVALIIFVIGAYNSLVVARQKVKNAYGLHIPPRRGI